MPERKVQQTELAGLYTVEIVINADSRGSFREAYQEQKLEALGLPKLGPVQWNISENLRAGIVRGIHAEPWDKYIHVIQGRAFSAIVDLRPDSTTFGYHKTFELTPNTALFVSKGFGNAYQALEANTIYAYLVNAHWTMGTTYPSVRFDDPDLQIAWPMQPGPDDVSEKDRKNPTLRQAFPAKFPN